MAKVLSTQKHSALNYLIKTAYESIYSKLKSLLGAEIEFFASVETDSQNNKWFGYNNYQYKTYSSASEEEKDLASIYLGKVKKDLDEKLSRDPDLKGSIDKVFTVPDEDQVFIYYDHEGILRLTLAQWGCKSVSQQVNPNPLGIIISRPKKDYQEVNLIIIYSDKSPYSLKEFIYGFEDVSKTLKTDKNGNRNMGYFKTGNEFTISDQNEHKPHQKRIQVVEDQTNYEVVFPKYASLKVSVQNQLNEAVRAYDLTLDDGVKYLDGSTDENGEVIFTNLLKTENGVSLYSENAPDNVFNVLLLEEKNTYTITLQEEIFRSPEITVINEEGIVEVNYPINLAYSGLNNNYFSNIEGLVIGEEKLVNYKLIVSDGHDKYNSASFEVSHDTFSFVFNVKKVVPKLVKIRLLNHKNKVLPSVPLDLFLKSGERNRITDQEGLINLPFDDFTNEEKVSVKINFDKKKTKKKQFTFDEKQLEYIIKLKKFNKLWLFIPLLLLLFIPLKKDIIVNSIHESSLKPVVGSEIYLNYSERHIFKNGRFFYKKEHRFRQISDSSGKATFSGLNYSVFSFVFHSLEKAGVWGVSECVSSDTVRPYFHWTFKPIQLYFKPSQTTLDFKVIDDEDGSPISKAKIVYTLLYAGEAKKDSVVTGPDGLVLISNLPRCGRLMSMTATKYGYYSDSILANDIEKLPGPIDNLRRMELKPKLEKLVFYVKSCKTGQPIPDAEVVLQIRGGRGKELNQSIPTNIDGIGKGIHEKAHIASQVQINARKKFFKPGKLRREYTVEEFTMLPDSLRTICLEPEPNSIDFQNIDSLTKQGIPGVKNIVKVENNGQIRYDTLSSNRNGVFTIANVIIGDKISIISSKTPYYKDNNETILDKDGIALIEGDAKERTIPLAPRKVRITFWTKDAILETLLPGVSLEVTIDGEKVRLPDNSGKGEFEVEVLYSSIISITGRKSGYRDNDYSIKDKAAAYLENSPQADRTVMMGYFPCAESSDNSVINKQALSHYDLQKPSGVFEFEYDTDSAPDRIVIYDGPNHTYPVIFQINEATNGFRTVSVNFTRRVITIDVSSAKTRWNYIVNCP